MGSPPGSLSKNAEKIRLFYEEEGYYQARVDGREERISAQEVAVTFDIVEVWSTPVIGFAQDLP